MRTFVAALTLVGTLALSGCGGGAPIPTLPPTPSATPIFASEEEALAAAEEAYAAYLKMSDLIASEGGVNPERIAPFVTERRLGEELRGFATLRESELRIAGSAAFSTIGLQRYDEGGGAVEVVLYVCLDLSGSRVVDAAGEDVTPMDRSDVLALEVVVQSVESTAALVLENDDQWPGDSC